MPKLLARQAESTDALAGLLADPDERPQWFDGMTWNGYDPAAEHRRRNRERVSGKVEERMTTEARSFQHNYAPDGDMAPMSLSTTIAAQNSKRPYTRKATAFETPASARGEQRHEIIYCADCGRELHEGEYERTNLEVVMTSFGGIVSQRTQCQAHPDRVVAMATYFVVAARG